MGVPARTIQQETPYVGFFQLLHHFWGIQAESAGPQEVKAELPPEQMGLRLGVGAQREELPLTFSSQLCVSLALRASAEPQSRDASLSLQNKGSGKAVESRLAIWCERHLLLIRGPLSLPLGASVSVWKTFS